ncbi:MAG: SCO family protein [Bryobacteraceae bacterium]
MLRISAILGSILALSTVCLAAAPPLPAELEGVGITERLGEKVDLNLTFVNESGKLVRLGEYFRKDRPVVLNLVYYSCPMLCTLVLNGQTAALRNIPGSPGKDFEIVTISIDPSETPDLAREKKQAYIGELGRGGEGWHFLSDHDGNVQRLAAQVGFHYRYDESIRQYAHAAAIMILTPQGNVSRYLYGIEFKPRDLRLALAEASIGKFSASLDRLLLFCYHYDPTSRSYVPFAANIMKAGGALTVLVLGTILGIFWRRERRSGATGVATAA